MTYSVTDGNLRGNPYPHTNPALIDTNASASLRMCRVKYTLLIRGPRQYI